MVDIKKVKPGEIYKYIAWISNESLIFYNDKEGAVIEELLLSSGEEFLVIEVDGLWLHISSIGEEPKIGWITVKRDYFLNILDIKCLEKVVECY